jgi:hypothetical protein
MLQTNDIGELFAQLQGAYGTRWQIGADAIPVWQKGLYNVTREQAMAAVPVVIQRHADFPPSLGQFLSACTAQRPRPSTYLPAPTGAHKYHGFLKHNMLRILIDAGGVDRHTLKNMVALKNALAEENPNGFETNEQLNDFRNQLRDLAQNCDKEKRQDEAARSRSRLGKN